MDTNEKTQIIVASALIVAGTAIAAFCMIKANRLLKKDDALWAETATEDQK